MTYQPYNISISLVSFQIDAPAKKIYAFELMFCIPKISCSGTSLVLCTIYESLSTPYWACSIPRTISAASGPRYGNGTELQG